jgi:Flp pilus assembly protein TadB
MTFVGYLEHPDSWTKAIIIGLFDGVFFGAIMGPMQVNKRRKRVAAIGDMPARDLRVASRAVMRGPVPTDLRIRQAAQWLATNQLKETSRFRLLVLILLAFVAMVSVAIALTSTPWWWIWVVAIFSMFAFFLLMPIHLRRRIEMLKLEASSS